jgi:hypothetical protein
MHKSAIHEGNTIITKPVKGKTFTGVVTSTRGTKRCGMRDENGTIWNVPYDIIIACSQDVKPANIVKAKVGDVLQIKSGAKFRVDKVNRSRYATTRLSDGEPITIPFEYSFVIVQGKESQQDAQRAYLMGKGFTAKDVAEFEKLFPTNS